MIAEAAREDRDACDKLNGYRIQLAEQAYCDDGQKNEYSDSQRDGR